MVVSSADGISIRRPLYREQETDDRRRLASQSSAVAAHVALRTKKSRVLCETHLLIILVVQLERSVGCVCLCVLVSVCGRQLRPIYYLTFDLGICYVDSVCHYQVQVHGTSSEGFLVSILSLQEQMTTSEILVKSTVLRGIVFIYSLTVVSINQISS